MLIIIYLCCYSGLLLIRPQAECLDGKDENLYLQVMTLGLYKGIYRGGNISGIMINRSSLIASYYLVACYLSSQVNSHFGV